MSNRYRKRLMCITHKQPSVNGKYENGKIWAAQEDF